MLIQSMPAGAGTKLQFAQTLADDDLVYTIVMPGQGDAGDDAHADRRLPRGEQTLGGST